MTCSTRDSNDMDSECTAHEYWQPSLLNRDATCGTEYKCEWRRYLIRKNLEQIAHAVRRYAGKLRFSFYGPRTINAVFETCKMLKQPPEVKYLALDILDRFMVRHFFSVAQTLQARDIWSETIWRIVKGRMIAQSYLRMLSSIQIASKYCTRSRGVTMLHLQKVLMTLARTHKHNFSRRDLLKSEVRILTTLQFNIPVVTPLTFIEMFFEDFVNFGLVEELNTAMDSFLIMCIRVLDVAFVFHAEIFQHLFKKMNEHPLAVEHGHFPRHAIEADYMYLAAAVIHTATTILDPSNVVPGKLLKFFSLKTKYNAEEISILSRHILEVILTK